MKKFAGVALLSGLLFSTVGLSNQALAADQKSSNATVTYQDAGTEIETKPDVDENGKDIINTGLPTDLDFGTHKNGLEKQDLTAQRADGSITKGTLKINDLRGATTPIGWNVKVNQTAQFKNGTSELTNAALTIQTGAITNVGGTLPSKGLPNQAVKLVPGTEVQIFGASAGTGDGQSVLGLEQFDLEVPAKIVKTNGVYKSELTWTLSDTPAI